MRELVAAAVAVLIGSAVAGGAFAGGTVRIAHARVEISPEVGAKICGYSPNQFSVAKHDPLYACLLAVDDGERKALIAAFDLLGLDGFVIRDLRRKCAAALGTEERFVLFSCTHTHEGPESVRRMNLPDSVNAGYLEGFEKVLLGAVAKLKASEWKDCTVRFISLQADENRSRRFVTPDNHASFTPHRPTLSAYSDGYADKELGVVAFRIAGRTQVVPGGDAPEYVIGNYAAHALAAHAPGLGGITISADFPGFYRDYLRKECGVESMFVAGAGGDLVPREDELGFDAARLTGVNLAKKTILGLIAMERGQSRFELAEPRLGGSIATFTAPIRTRFRNRIQHEYDGDAMTLEVQCLSIGDIAFVGMPGEATSALGSEIKWHSPFRRTFIANLSTGFAGYISGANAFVQGGYEPKKQPFSCRGSMKLVTTAVDALFALRASVFPDRDADPYPDNLDEPLVNLPGGVKASNFRFNEEKVSQ